MKKMISTLFSLLLLCNSCSQQSDTSASKSHILRVALESDPLTLDPRLARSLVDTTVMHMLYEGLIRVNKEGKVEYVLAEEIIPSDDRKSYTVHLRESYWSDGSPVTAEDFVETWKSMLDPSFPSSIAAQLFVIKNAKEAKTGIKGLEEVGLLVLSPTSFRVVLNEPIVMTDEMFATRPVHIKVRENKASSDPQDYLYNGPFILNKWQHHDQLAFAKNAHYWDQSEVKLDGITLIITENSTALNLFQKGQLDWVGSPLATLPQDALQDLKDKQALHTADSCGTYWFRFNTQKPPFTSLNIRKAFNLALHRQDIVEHVTQGNQKPALSILPPSIHLQGEGYFQDGQKAQANEYVARYLEEENISKELLPPITLSYLNIERHHKIAQAVQQQWKDNLGIDISLQAYESMIALDKLSKGSYQIMLGSWFGDIKDPVNFLNVFKTRASPSNHTFWENSQYTELLEQSNYEIDPAKRLALMARAESILMQAMPVAPLFYNAYNYLKKPQVQDVYFSELGYLDFKRASFVRTDS